MVRINPLYNYSHPKFFDEPEKFKPERWFNKDRLTDPFAFIPFSAGAHNCIGQHLAIIESKIIMAEFLLRFNYKIPDEYQLRMGMNFLYEPTDPLVANLSLK